MENSPSNSIEKQIDNFLEHFKRSASKAMDADWCSSGSGSSISGGGGGGSSSGSPPSAGELDIGLSPPSESLLMQRRMRVVAGAGRHRNNDFGVGDFCQSATANG